MTASKVNCFAFMCSSQAGLKTEFQFSVGKMNGSITKFHPTLPAARLLHKRYRRLHSGKRAGSSANMANAFREADLAWPTKQHADYYRWRCFAAGQPVNDG